MYALTNEDKKMQLLLLETLDYKFGALIATQKYEEALILTEEMLPLYKRFFKRFPERVLWLNVHRAILYQKSNQIPKADNIKKDWEEEWEALTKKRNRKDSVIYFKLAHQIGQVYASYPQHQLDAERYFIIASNCPIGLIKSNEGQDFYLMNSQAHANLLLGMGEQTGKRLLHEQSYQYGQMLMRRTRNHEYNDFIYRFFGRTAVAQVVERIYIEMRMVNYPNINQPVLHPIWKSMADYYMQTGEYIGARLLYQECSYYYIEEKGHQSLDIAQIYWEMALLYYQKHDVSKSKYYYSLALETIASKNGTNDDLYLVIECDYQMKFPD